MKGSHGFGALKKEDKNHNSKEILRQFQNAALVLDSPLFQTLMG